MERVDSTAPDSDGNWASNDGVHRQGLDAQGEPINGTPGGLNSTTMGGGTPPPVPTEAPTATSTPSVTPSVTEPPTATSTMTAPATALPTTTETVQPTVTTAPSATLTGTPTSAPSPTVTGPATSAPTPTATLAPEPTLTATAAPDMTATPEPSASPSVTPTEMATATPLLLPLILIHELLYDAPQSGQDAAYEWVEIYNPGSQAISLAGWRLADNSAEDTLPDILLSAGGLIVVAANASAFRENHPDFGGGLVEIGDGRIGGGLGNDGDQLALLAPSGVIVDAVSYGNDATWLDPPAPDVPVGHSLERQPAGVDSDTAADWADRFPPSPGELAPSATPTMTPDLTGTPTPSVTPSPESSATATKTPVVTPSATATADATITPTPTATAEASSTPTPTVTLSPTATATVIAAPDGINLNEVLPAPRAVDWDGDGTANAEDEWIELHNLGSQAVDLGGWALDDVADGGSLPYVIPAGTQVAAGGLVVFFRRQSGVVLNNDVDEVRLLAPDGSLRDQFAYLHTRPDVAFARTVDGTGGWTDQYPPSPDMPNQAATPTPTLVPQPRTVYLNEILPAPRDRDWDSDGNANAEDEWIELINIGEITVDLVGWGIDDVADGGSQPYIFPPGSLINPGEYRLIFRRDSGIALNNDSDQARLLFPDGQEADRYQWVRSPGFDRSLGRRPDGRGGWEISTAPSPGVGNLFPEPTPLPTAVSGGPGDSTPAPDRQEHATPSPADSSLPVLAIADARRQPLDRRVRVRGQVTVPPGVFESSIYVQDASAGIQVYLNRAEWPSLQAGDWIEVIGSLADFHGESELKVRRVKDVTMLGPGQLPEPIILRCDQIGELYEGMLVMIAGRVSGFGPRELRLNDSRSDAQVYVREGSGRERPWVESGEWWSAVGVVSQYVAAQLYVGGYRLLPRYRDDLAPIPSILPDIGSAVSVGG